MERYMPFLIFVLLIVGLATLWLAVNLQRGTSKLTVVTPMTEVDVRSVTGTIALKEGVGPTPGEAVDGTLTFYGGKYEWTIRDLYDLPAGLVVFDGPVSTTNGKYEFDWTVDPDFVENGKFYVTVLAEATDYYKASTVLEFPTKKKVPADSQAAADGYTTHDVGQITIKLEKIGSVGVIRDPDYEYGTAPALKWSGANEVYNSIFYVRVEKNTDTDNPTGVWYLDEVKIEAVDTNLENKLDQITVKIGEVEETFDAGDLPETIKLDEPVKIVYGEPLEISITATTPDDTATLTAGDDEIKFTFTDVAENTLEVTVKAG